MPRSPQWMDLYQIWFRGSSLGRNQLCGILLQSAHGFRYCEGSKFAISHWLGWSPLTQCWRYRAACDSQTFSSSNSDTLAWQEAILINSTFINSCFRPLTYAFLALSSFLASSSLIDQMSTVWHIMLCVVLAVCARRADVLHFVTSTICDRAPATTVPARVFFSVQFYTKVQF